MTDVTTLLAGIKTLEEAATKGTWRTFTAEGVFAGTEEHVVTSTGTHILLGPEDGQAGQALAHNAAFIAAARTDIPRLVAALEAVAGLHQSQEEDQLWCILDEECEDCYPESGDGTGHAMTVCSECRAKVDDVTGFIPWPCPTITAVVAALEGEGA